MLTGRAAVLEWFDDSKGNYWYIYNYGQASNGANIAYASDQEENITHQKARDSLSKALSIISGRFDIVATETATRKPKGDWKISFQINQAEERSNVSGVGNMNVVQGISPEDVAALVKKGIDEYKREQLLEQSLERIKQLEKENKELDEAANDPWNKIGEVAIPLLHRWLGPAAQVAGFPPTSTEPPSNANFKEDTGNAETTIQLTDEQQTRLANVIAILYNIAPDVWLDKLEKLAAMVQHNPAYLNMIN